MIDDDERVESNFADLIVILRSIYEDGDKFWDKNKDWLLDDRGEKVFL